MSQLGKPTLHMQQVHVQQVSSPTRLLVETRRAGRARGQTLVGSKRGERGFRTATMCATQPPRWGVSKLGKMLQNINIAGIKLFLRTCLVTPPPPFSLSLLCLHPLSLYTILPASPQPLYHLPASSLSPPPPATRKP